METAVGRGPKAAGREPIRPDPAMALDLLALLKRRWLYAAAALLFAGVASLLVRPASAGGNESSLDPIEALRHE